MRGGGGGKSQFPFSPSFSFPHSHRGLQDSGESSGGGGLLRGKPRPVWDYDVLAELTGRNCEDRDKRVEFRFMGLVLDNFMDAGVLHPTICCNWNCGSYYLGFVCMCSI